MKSIITFQVDNKGEYNMTIKQTKKFAVIIALLILGLTLFSLRAYGAVKSLTKNIKATYRNINIYSYGKKLSSQVEPFILTEQGVTMVPLRLISEALGHQIVWVEETSSIYIGNAPDTVVNNSKSLEPTLIEDIAVLRNVGPFYELKSRNIVIARRQFKSGIAVELKNENSIAEVVLELKGYYNYLEGYIGIDDETRNSSTGFILSVYGDGLEKTVESLVSPSEYPRPIRVDVKGVSRLTIRIEGQDCEIGEYERTIAALADFKFYKE
jgi:hypothetical protein